MNFKRCQYYRYILFPEEQHLERRMLRMDYRVNVQETAITHRWWESRNDDHPTERRETVWDLELEVETSFPWGPLKTRANAKVEHSGNSLIRVREFETFHSKEEAERHSVELCSRLNSKGYQGVVTFDSAGLFKKNWSSPVEEARILSNGIPRAIQKKVLESAREQIRDIFRG